MEGLLYISFNAFCIAELLMIFGKICKGVDKRIGQVMLAWFIVASVILLSSDMVWGVFEYYIGWDKHPAASFAVNSVYHIFTGVVAYLWFLFSESEQNSRLVKSKKGILLSMLPLFILINLVVGSNANHWVFYIDPVTGEYQRGKFYFAMIVICAFYIALTTIKAFVKAFRKENYLRKNQLLALASFALYPIFASVLQVLFVGSPMISGGIAFAVLHVYINSRELLISIDPMTQLNNRTHMEDFLDGKMKSKPENKELYVFIMDLDYFKQINDEYGHLEGDAAIVIAADTIRSIVNRTDYFACRYGGDEFVIICETNKDFKPKEFLNHINECLAENTKKHGKEYKLKFSVGYKRYSKDYADVQDFLKAADEGLYMIKNSREPLALK
ncbi:MAG: diguanylate cyclase [Clostridia bacterium]|nr:diguanylate cyclase [Clostridia bacterium]